MTRLEQLAHRAIGEIAVAIILPLVILSDWRHERRIRSLRRTREYLAAVGVELGNPHVQASRHARTR